MTIRHATADDGKPVVQLIIRAIQDIALQLTGETTEKEAAERLLEFYRTEGTRFSFRHILVKEADGQVAGMILCYHGKDAADLDKPILERLKRKLGNPDAALDVETDPDEFYIDSFAVFAPYSGRGYGTELIQAAERWAVRLGHSKIALNVDYANEKAHALYRRLGYVQDKDVTINAHPFRHMIKLL
ncbi:GNAT family N-acetyltransferase [Cohnella thailandensis]|uniref:GNAT family N-acetyltransferase n=1 Tax=Cohnella thailandensis TaxID=557557 RepID=A0A841SUZ1_9BACL|nr:GNAT family N-acetyltransferase [Cohnella thailandensis]MBB6633875.1 GNAT family N-acetyltransferase [Cohnella thailandensis]MBP1972558.1 GNAT superfamily N-acetyltransferase [Cohnella thailandensis]